MKHASFLPDDYVDKRAQYRANVICLGLFVIVMGAVTAAFVVTNRQRDEVKQLQGHVNEQFRLAAERLEQLDKLQGQKQQMVRKARITAALIERLPRSVVLAELINNMPMNLSLLNLEVHTRALKAPPTAATALEQAKQDAKKKDKLGDMPAPLEIPGTEVRLELVGVAPTDVEVAAFLTSLGQSQMFTDQNLIFSQEATVDRLTVRKFRIDVILNQDIDPGLMDPLMVRRELRQNPMSDQVRIVPLALDAAQATTTPATMPTASQAAVSPVND